MSNFGFSVKQFVELARDFKVRYLIWGKRAQKKVGKPAPTEKRQINWRLLVVAILTLVFTFGLEVVILYLSSPEFTSVTNSKAAFTVEENFIPDWNQIRDNAVSAANRPCVSLTIMSDSGVSINQGNTRITPCLSAVGNLNSDEQFERVTDPVEMEFISDTHEFGAEHRITIGDDSAEYRTIVYFALEDKSRKIMRKRAQYFTRQAAVFYVQQQFVAYLFTEYTRRTKDTKLDLEYLKSLNFDTKIDDGPNIIITQINKQERFRKVTSTRHITKVTGNIPRGPPALRFAVAYLKGSTGLSVQTPDLNDMDVGSSSTWGVERRMWQEQSRLLNWLTLTIVLLASLVILAILRHLLKPIGTAEIAGAFVSRQVGAQPGRAVSLMSKDEKSTFSLLMHRETSGSGLGGNVANGDDRSVDTFDGAGSSDSYNDSGVK